MFVFLLIVALTLTYLVSTVIKPKKYPPGPRWYPFFGCNGIISSRMSEHGSQWKVLSEMAKEYSTNVLGLKLGSELVVVVYGLKNIRYVATEKDFDARPDSFFLRLRTLGKRTGITFVDGPLWREHRPFTLKILRNFGFGKRTMDIEIQLQLSQLHNRLENCNGKPVNIRKYTAMAMLNIVWMYVAGEYLEEDRMNQLLKSISERTKAFTMAGGYLNQWPWLRFILPRWSGYSIITKLNSQMLSIIQEAVTKHKNNNIPGNDLINSFLEEMSVSKEYYTDDQLNGICLDFLLAGASTGSNFLDFAIIMLLRHPDKQQKVYDEIKQVLGDNFPSWADNEKLVYTSAFICEVHRCCTIAPFAGGRRALTNVTIDGHVIPKGATVLLSLGDLHSDPDVWSEPDKFSPERFIDNTGRLKTTLNVYPFSLGFPERPRLCIIQNGGNNSVQDENEGPDLFSCYKGVSSSCKMHYQLVRYGTEFRDYDHIGHQHNVPSTYTYVPVPGRRRCLGEPFAKVFIFIMLTGLVQKYMIVCSGTPPSAEPIIGILAEPRHFTAQFVKRLT